MRRALEVVAGDAVGSDDETRVVRAATVAAPPRAPEAGYVPPAVPDRPPAPAVRPRPRSRAQSRPVRRGSPWSALGMLAMLAAAALVVALVVVPLLDLGGNGEGSGELPSNEPSAEPTVAPNVIPATIGMSTDEAIALASQAGLNWTVRCNHDESQPSGIIDQEPAAGTEVAPGSRFTMFSARIEDCGGGEGNGRGNGGRGNDD
jgi:hypothetical protein